MEATPHIYYATTDKFMTNQKAYVTGTIRQCADCCNPVVETNGKFVHFALPRTKRDWIITSLGEFGACKGQPGPVRIKAQKTRSKESALTLGDFTVKVSNDWFELTTNSLG
jgi:hypothetical protein